MIPLSAKLPIFVYGTLRSGQCNYLAYLAHTVHRKFPARAHNHSMFALDVPVVIDGPGTVTGELMIIRAAEYAPVIAALDRLEGCAPDGSGLYERVPRPVRYTRPRAGRERVCQAWIYQATPVTMDRFRTAARVASGDWVEWAGSVG